MPSRLFTPTKIPFSLANAYFKEGTVALRAYWLQRDHQGDSLVIQQEAAALAESYTPEPIYCQLATCVQKNRHQPVSFPSVTAYELHYETHHRHTCSACNRTFPNQRWLQLHCDELHNTLNKIKKDRGDKIYACFVEDCGKYFKEPRTRRLHLIDKHKYPSFFPFRIVVTGTIAYEEQRQYNTRQRHRRHQNQLDTKTMDLDPPRSASHDASDDENRDHDGATDGMERDNDPSHTITSENNASSSLGHADNDMEIDALASQLSRVRLPPSISFGRRKKAMWHAPHAPSRPKMDTDP